ncbi:MAG: hypothetical protein CL878_04570 [Dehalococcoidia bacterium]|nr:hypothetical protein [Dehalococcoidia bacterium]
MSIEEWLDERSEKDRVLYQQYGKSLEQEHRGKFLAISDDGKTIPGKNDVEILAQAIAEFGSGNFAFVRVGHLASGLWMNVGQ